VSSPISKPLLERVLTQSSLDFHITQSSTDVERALILQNDHSSHFRSQFEKFEDSLNSSVSTMEHLAQAHELNGRLEEKLKAVEETLVRATRDCERSMSVEKDLREKISDLEADLEAARQPLVNPPTSSMQAKEEQDRLSRLQIQLQETSTALLEEKEKVKSKESEVCDLRRDLSEIERSLEDTTHRMKAMEIENAELHDQVRHVEYKVREELSRASLTSRDQNRAWFEQQVHKLKQEKVAAENSAVRFQEQLAIMQESLVSGLFYSFWPAFLTATQNLAERSKSASGEQEEKVAKYPAYINLLPANVFLDYNLVQEGKRTGGRKGIFAKDGS
jgi:chromosome segregation ATPase